MTRRNFIYGSAAAAAAAAFLRGTITPPAGHRGLPAGPAAAGGKSTAQVDEPPYLWGQNSSTGAASFIVSSSSGTGTSAGDAIVVCVSTNGYNQFNNNQVTVSDGSNTYVSVFTTVPANGDLAGWIFVATGSNLKSPLTGSSQVTVTFDSGGNNTGAHTAIVIGVPGVTQYDTDANASSTGSSTTPNATVTSFESGVTNATLVAMEVNGDGGGAVSWTAPFAPVPVYGGGTITMSALSPGGDHIVAGGDVEGYFLTDNLTHEFGTQWEIINSGVSGAKWRDCACIAWSALETTDDGAGVIYSCCGDQTGGGGFLVSADNGNTWTLRSGTGGAAPQFAGNHASFTGNGYPRATGNLLVQDTSSNKIIYAGAYSGGVYSSTADSNGQWGTSWTQLGGSGSGNPFASDYIITALAMDASQPSVLYAAAYNTSSSAAEVWVTTNSPKNGTATTWSKISTKSGPQTAQELIIIGKILYAACGTNGVYQYVPPATGGPTGGTWNSLNDGTYIAADQAGNNSSWGNVFWGTLAGYKVSSTEHVFIAFADNPVEVTVNGTKEYRALVQVTVSNPGKSSQTFTPSDLIVGATLNVSSYPTPNGPQDWWHAGANYADWLGGGAFINAYITIDPNNTNNIYITGAEGFYYTTNGGGTWNLAINGMAIFTGRSVNVDPANENHFVFSDSDWFSWDLTQGSEISFNVVPGPSPGNPLGGYPPSGSGSLEGYTLAFDPIPASGVDNVFVSSGEKYTNAYGNVLSRASTDTTWTTNTGLYTPANGNLAIGLAVVRDSSAPSNQYVLAAVEDPTGTYNGIWLMTNGGSWSQISATTGSSGIGYKNQSTSYMPFAAPIVAMNASSGPSCVYVIDRGAAQVWRGAPNSSGTLLKKWAVLWDIGGGALTDPSSGFVALNPSPLGSGDELWVTTPGAGPYKITGANTGTVSGTPPSVPLPGGLEAGGLAFASDGTLYCTGLASPNTILFSLPNGATSTSDWQQVGGPGVAANASNPTQIAVSPSGIVYIANSANVVAWGYPSAGWTQLGTQHPGADQYTAVATQVVTSAGQVTGAGTLATSANWLMILAALDT